jgi:hypothetical protein
MPVLTRGVESTELPAGGLAKAVAVRSKDENNNELPIVRRISYLPKC